ncbi:MAG: SGNH/GDSL hydrolase family protein [Bacteroidetes bacterium]|nr:SGNH/GDSL hydrolase family protein [Bacteroidota bacterium]
MKKIVILLIIIFCIYGFTQKQISWVAIGDSITYLNDHQDETDNRLKKGYLTRVAEKIPGLKYINQGHNGWTSGGIAKEINNLGLVKADIYSVFLGTNDWWQGRPVGKISDYQNNTGNQTVFGSFRIIIDKLKQLNKDAEIILITPMQRSDFVYINDMTNNAYGSYKEKNNQSLALFADAIKAIGKYEHLPVIDLYNKSGITQKNLVKFKHLKDPSNPGTYKNYPYPDFISIPFDPRHDDYPYPPDAIDMTYDGLHPSDKGCEVISNMLAKAIKKLLR